MTEMFWAEPSASVLVPSQPAQRAAMQEILQEETHRQDNQYGTVVTCITVGRDAWGRKALQGLLVKVASQRWSPT